MVSKKRSAASNRRLDEALWSTAIKLIGTHYSDFGPTLACEKLAELHEVRLSVESTRQLMINAGHWRPKKGGSVCAHPMRERRARFGEMIQIDGSIFRINAKEADPEAETQFLRAARELGIECIHAYSPHAKGPIERVNQTLQDRLVKEMRLAAGINNMEQANRWLPGYIEDFNRRFAVAPKNTSDAHLAYAEMQINLSCKV